MFVVSPTSLLNSCNEHKVIFCHFFAPLPSVQDDGAGAEAGAAAAAATLAGPLSMDDLDQTISAFNTVEQLFRTLNPNTWRLDLDTVFDQKHILYRSRKYFMANRLNKGERWHWFAPI